MKMDTAPSLTQPLTTFSNPTKTRKYPFQVARKPERPVNITPTNHLSKQTDKRTTPVRRDHMEGVELFSKTNHDSFLIPSQLLTQPILPSTPPSDNNNKQPLSPSTPDSPNMASMLNALAQALATYPEGYDSDKLMYVHRENRNRKLFCVGLAHTAK
jgi:hypothetical protein